VKARGFTLIELLIVVVIIGLLATIAIPKVANTKQKAYVAQMKSDLKNLATAQEAFFYDSTYYTSSLASLNNFSPSTGVTLNVLEATPGGWSAGRSTPRRPGSACCTRGLRRQSPRPPARVGLPAPRSTVSGIPTPPRGDAIRPERRRLAAQAQDRRRADGPPGQLR